MNLFDKLTGRIFAPTLEKRLRQALAMAEMDSTWALGGRGLGESERDRLSFDREEVLRQSLDAWRINPLARRIVGLTTQYVVGGGISISCKQAATSKFLDAFWNHRLNRMPVRVSEFCDELARSGNLFLLLSTDAAGMSYVRAVPALEIERIESRPNDIEQPLRFYPRPTLDDPDPQPWPAYDDLTDGPGADGRYPVVMLHYAINRPVGAQWGESDLAPELRWLSRYAGWLEDRARLNRFRNIFLYVVKGRYASESERIARQRALNANPPGPGSILVTGENESWEVIAPRLESADANTDGLALKKMIASGAGVPLHFLAEPESSTRTTAEAAGGPTYRHFEQRQRFFLWMLSDLLRVVANRRTLVDSRVSVKADVHLQGADISARDNVALGLAAGSLVSAMGSLRDRGLIDDAEMLRMVYRFAGEACDVEELLKQGRKAGPSAGSGGKRPPLNVKAVDVETGEPKPNS